MEVLRTTLHTVEAAHRPNASKADLDNLGQLFDQVSAVAQRCTEFGPENSRKA